MPVGPATHRRSRATVGLLFLTMGIVLGSWAARIPDVRGQLQTMSDARWGIVTISATVGSLFSLITMLVLVGRVGPRRLALTGACLLLTNAPLVASSHRAISVVLGLAVQGFAANLMATSMNAQAVVVERGYGRGIMASFHALYSVGQLSGGVLGIVATRTGVSPSAQLGVTAVALGVALLACVRWLPHDEVRDPPQVRAPMRQRISPQLVLLAFIALLAALNEGTAVQWSALYASDALAAGAAAGAAAFSCFAIAMTVSRLVGDRITLQLGRRRLLIGSVMVSCAGMAVALGSGSLPAAFVGFALLGLGSGCVIPTVFGLAGNQPDVSAGEGVSVAAAGQWPAFMLGPPLVGALAGLVGLRGALVIVIVASVGIAAAAQRIEAPVSVA